MSDNLNYIFQNYKNNKVDKARLASVNLVYLVLEEKSFSNISLNEVFKNFELIPLDRKFASAISYGTLSNLVNIDEIISNKSKIKLNNLDPFVRSILRTAVWQIFYSEKIPLFSVCDESVKLIKLHKNKGNIAFVNAVLRAIIGDKSNLKETYIENPKKFHLKCKMPPELAGYFKKWFGESRAIEICDSMNDIPLMSVRINTLVSDLDYVKQELALNNFEVYESSYMDNALLIKTGGNSLEKVDAFTEGSFTIQDESAMLVGLVANPKPGQVIADLCSAPGGKACHIADIMKNEGEIYAFDINESRISLIDENKSRLNVKIINTKNMDALEVTTKDIGDKNADIVLLDVPCSGLGIIRKKPEIKYNMTHEKIIGLYSIQESILNNGSKLVKSGGFLIYSTCTLNPKENEEQIVKFLSINNKEFELVDFSDMIPKRLELKDQNIIKSAKEGMITIYPDIHGSDGFFIAKLRRK